jgi:hypothetical protein
MQSTSKWFGTTVNSALLVACKIDGGDKSSYMLVSRVFVFCVSWPPIRNKEMAEQACFKPVNTKQCSVQFYLSNENRQKLCNTHITWQNHHWIIPWQLSFISTMWSVEVSWLPKQYCHVSQWLKTGFGLVIAVINHLQVITTINYYATADLHNLQSLHTNLFSLSALIVTDLWHRNYNSLTKSHTPNITVLLHT